MERLPPFVSNVIGYGLFFLSVAAMRTPAGYRQERAVAKHFARDVFDGVAAIWAHDGIKLILLLLLFGDGLYGAVRQMAPAFADRALGASFEICRTGALALLQLSVADAVRGRMSTLFLLTRLAGAAGVAVVGSAAANWGLRPPLLCGAALALMAWVAAYCRTAAAFGSLGGAAMEGEPGR